MQHLAKRVGQVAMPMTIEMSQKSRELQEQGYDVISLSLGEPDFDTPGYIKEAGKEGIDQNYTHYMPVAGYTDLREAISAKFKRENNLDYSPAEIVVSTGAKHSIINVMLALVDEGEEVIIPAPYWVSYLEQVKLLGAKPVVLPTSLKTEFKISPEQLQVAMNKNSRLMVFSSPCNPSGAMYSRAELEALVDVIASKKDFYVLYDEIYEYITYGKEHVSLAGFDKIKDQVITVNGLSKGFAMTGWRIGYIGAPAWLAKACNKIQSQFTSGTSSISQRAAMAAVNSTAADIQYMVDAFSARRDLMYNRLSEVPGFKMQKPDGTFYMFIEVNELIGKKTDQEVINTSYDLSMYLLNKGLVSSVPGEAFGLPGYIRFSFAASTEVLEEACERIAAAVAKLN
jgi:aspartate aminotransferase